MVKFSDEQLDIISAPRSNILVSAAAGSGKTTVLAARITSKIINKELGIDELLVVTFTKDAATHMREKIESSLRNELKKPDADRQYIKAQIDKLSGAYIQTMNSFCNRVVSESGHLSQISDLMEPGSMVLDETTLQILRSAAATDVISEVYEQIADGVIEGRDREDFLNLVFSMGNGKSEAPVANALIDAYSKLRGLPDYIGVIDDIVSFKEKLDEEDYRVGSDRYIEIYDSLTKKIIDQADSAIALLDELDTDDESKSLTRGTILAIKSASEDYLSSDDRFEAIRRFREDVYRVSDPNYYKGLYKDKANINYEFYRAYGPIAAVCVMNRNLCKRRGRDIPRNAPKGYPDASAPYMPNEDYNIFDTLSDEEIMRKQRRRTSCSRAFAKLLKLMDSRYSSLKKNLRGIDYSDQEHMCLAVLKSSEACDLYKNRFKEIYIDEYQDNTSLQDAVVECISNDNVFCVGDVKQSIYKFRNANPSMFIRKAEKYSKDPAVGMLMELNCNYRSSPQIIGFINEIFAQLMSKDASEIDYEAGGHRLVASAKADDGPVPEVILINAPDRRNGENEDVTSLELTVSEVKRKVDEYHAMNYRWKDIFVLTRTNNAARAVADHLRSFNIPARCVDKKPIFSDNEIKGICNLIKITANEYRDECLTGVLLAPYRFSNFTLDELAEIISSTPPVYRKMNLIIKVREYAAHGTDAEVKRKCEVFLDALDNLRSESVIKDINEFTDLLFLETGVKATLREYAPSELQKLTVFKNWLCENFLQRGSDISEVASVIDEMQSRIEEKAAIEYDMGGEDLVRCMSYHKSKGLENKCVIIADGKSSNESDTNSFISFKAGYESSASDPQGPGFICDDYDDVTSVMTTSLEKALAKENNRLEGNAEAIRLLYVALTRAEQRLCFIRSMDLSSDTLKKVIYTPIIGEDKCFSRDYFMRFSGLERLMLSALLRMKCSDDSSDLRGICDLPTEPSYRSAFEGVKVTVKTAEEITSEAVLDGANTEDVNVARDDGSLIKNNQTIYGCTGTDVYGIPKFVEYRHEAAMNTPAKTSVSALKQEEDIFYSNESNAEVTPSRLKTAINLQVLDTDDYIGESDKISGAALGTAVHKAMSFIDISRIIDHSSTVSEELNSLVSEGVLSDEEREAIIPFEHNIEIFALSPLGTELAKADKVGKAYYEKPMVCSMRIDDTDDYQLVQGTLDVMFLDEEGKAVIIDYKTDHIRSDDEYEIIRTVRDRHGAQLELYGAAVEASGIPVKARYVYLLRKDMAILI